MTPRPAADIDARHPLTLIYGSVPSLRQRLLTTIVAANLPESEREWGLVVLDAQEVKAEGIASQVACGSLMADTRIIVIRNLDRLPAAAQTAVAKALRHLSPGTMVVVDAETSGDYRRKGPAVAAELRKLFEAAGQIVEATAPDDRELPAWLAEEAAARGKTMSPAVARTLVETVGGRVDAVVNELEKLVTYVGPERKAIRLEDITAIVSGERESTVFELVDAIGRRDARTALSVLPALLAVGGVQGGAFPLLAMVARQLRLVWQARALSAAGVSLDSPAALPADWADRLPQEHNFFTTTRNMRFLTRKYAEQARSFSDVQMVRALLRVHETDLALKGQGTEKMDDRLALETLIVSLCRL